MVLAAFQITRRSPWFSLRALRATPHLGSMSPSTRAMRLPSAPASRPSHEGHFSHARWQGRKGSSWRSLACPCRAVVGTAGATGSADRLAEGAAPDPGTRQVAQGGPSCDAQAPPAITPGSLHRRSGSPALSILEYGRESGLWRMPGPRLRLHQIQGLAID